MSVRFPLSTNGPAETSAVGLFAQIPVRPPVFRPPFPRPPIQPIPPFFPSGPPNIFPPSTPILLEGKRVDCSAETVISSQFDNLSKDVQDQYRKETKQGSWEVEIPNIGKVLVRSSDSKDGLAYRFTVTTSDGKKYTFVANKKGIKGNVGELDLGKISPWLFGPAKLQVLARVGQDGGNEIEFQHIFLGSGVVNTFKLKPKNLCSSDFNADRLIDINRGSTSSAGENFRQLMKHHFFKYGSDSKQLYELLIDTATTIKKGATGLYQNNGVPEKDALTRVLNALERSGADMGRFEQIQAKLAGVGRSLGGQPADQAQYRKLRSELKLWIQDNLNKGLASGAISADEVRNTFGVNFGSFALSKELAGKGAPTSASNVSRRVGDPPKNDDVVSMKGLITGLSKLGWFPTQLPDGRLFVGDVGVATGNFKLVLKTVARLFKVEPDQIESVASTLPLGGKDVNGYVMSFKANAW